MLSYQSTPMEAFIMADIAATVTFARATLLQIAKQASVLGNGLQNIAPNAKAGEDNPSVQYLLSTSENILKLAEQCEKLL